MHGAGDALQHPSGGGDRVGPGLVGVRPQEDGPPPKRLVIGEGSGAGASRPGDNNIVGEDLRRRVGGLLAFDNNDGRVGASSEIRKPVERTRLRERLPLP